MLRAIYFAFMDTEKIFQEKLQIKQIAFIVFYGINNTVGSWKYCSFLESANYAANQKPGTHNFQARIYTLIFLTTLSAI